MDTSFKKGYHEYMKVWSLLLGECLFAKKEPNNGVDKNAACDMLNSCGREVVGHVVPHNILKVVPLYLSPPLCYLELEATGKHVNHGYELEIPPRFHFYGPEKRTQWLETRLTKIEEQL